MLTISAGLRWVLLMLQQWPIQEIGPRPRTRKEKSSPYFGCDFFSGLYNFWKIIKILAAGCHILKPKCTKFDFGWGFDQTPLGGLTALPWPLSWT